jgi:crossover junction endodeoxyribonuclease RuvC
MIFFGLDPGRSGAFAAITDAGELVSLVDLPYITDGKLAWVDAPELVSAFIAARQGRPARIYVERVAARPGQGVASMFAFGCGFGSLLAACRYVAAPLELVTPAKWKGLMGLGSDAEYGRRTFGRVAA